MSTIYLDVETIPSQRADVMARVARRHAHLDAEAAFAAADKDHRATALSPLFGEVIAIGVAVGVQPVSVLCRSRGGDSERDLLERAIEWIDAVAHDDAVDDGATTICGHNALAFDVPFLLRRCMILDVVEPPILRLARRQKPWETRPVIDTMRLWQGQDRSPPSLDDLARAFGLEGKSGHGSQVYDLWLAGKEEEIRDYCARDVEITREIAKRMGVV